ncbi:MAG: ParB/RepB/Spo0J family partition protein [Steroidobacteraceae bacterium]|jgi:ParB family chromosome partitioning protein|nr:ParB/RepB/Spo0J family partition protein [Steroidobacteraceae bacterium]MBP9130464.1 ParB/RepB/Spo0J family partition protein [Steroidobacteraceae bacterium]
MATKRPSLGRGLEALLGSVTPAPAPTPATAVDVHGTSSSPAPAPVTAALRDEELARIPVDLLQRGRYQPRLDMRPESLQELADSIRAQGVVQPIVVRPLVAQKAGEPVRYEIIAGERRWRAAQMAGLHDIPAVVRIVPDEAAVAMSLIENIQRENLNPLEEARALDRLIREFGITHQQAADAVGRSRAAVSNLLRLLELTDEVKTLVEQRQLEMGHARALLGLSQARQQSEVGALVAKKGLSVRETEALVKRMLAHGDKANRKDDADDPRPDPNVTRLEQDLADKLGARVSLQHARTGKGKLVIAYNSLDELDGILAHIK